MSRLTFLFAGLVVFSGLVHCTRTSNLEVRNVSGGVLLLVLEKTEEGKSESFSLNTNDRKTFRFGKIPDSRGPQAVVRGSGANKVPFVKTLNLSAGFNDPIDRLKVNPDIFQVTYKVSLNSASDALDRIRYVSKEDGTLDTVYSPAAPWTFTFTTSNQSFDFYLHAVVKTNTGLVSAEITVNGISLDRTSASGVVTSEATPDDLAAQLDD